MTYTSGTRTGATNSAEDLYSLISNQLSTHSNYTFIEDYTLATYKWSVWKVGALNSTGVPFYLLFNRTVAAGSNLYFGICEDYDAATHAAIRAAPAPTSSTKTPAADGSYQGATSTVLPNTTGVSTPQFGLYNVTASPSAYDYWIAANNDGMWVGTRIGAGAPAGAVMGTFDSLVDTPATNDPRPLFVAGDAGMSTSNSSGSATRHPMVTTAQGYLWGTSDWWTQTYIWTSQGATGAVGGTANDLFQNQKSVGSRVLHKTWAQYRGVGINLVGNNRGLYRHILYFPTAAGVAIGDTITIGSSTWVYTGKNVFYESSAT